MDFSSFAIESRSGRQRFSRYKKAPSVTQKHHLKFNVGWNYSPGRGGISRFFFGKAAIFQVPSFLLFFFRRSFFFFNAIGKLSWRRSTTPKKEASNTSLAEKVLANAKEAEKKQTEKKTEKKAGWWTLFCVFVLGASPKNHFCDICVFVHAV